MLNFNCPEVVTLLPGKSFTCFKCTLYLGNQDLYIYCARSTVRCSLRVGTGAVNNFVIMAGEFAIVVGLFLPQASASFTHLISSSTRPLSEEPHSFESTVEWLAPRPSAAVAVDAHTLFPNGGCSLEAIHKNHSTVTGSDVRARTPIYYPRGQDASADALCCSVSASGSGKYYTMAKLGPDPDRPDEDFYVCTTYGPLDPEHPAKFVAGNDSVSAGYSPNRPPPDPKCLMRTTLAECLAPNGPLGSQAACVWSKNTCTYEPPIDCGGVGAAWQYGPFCMGVALADHTYPTGGTQYGALPARPLHSFNWTSGTISGSVDPVALPPQVLTGDMWFSVEIEPVPWEICVVYNELSADGKSSDPDSAFQACGLTTPGGGIGLSRGHTSSLAIAPSFTLSTGWTASGHDPAKQGAVYGNFVVWSNSTADVVWSSPRWSESE